MIGVSSLMLPFIWTGGVMDCGSVVVDARRFAGGKFVVTLDTFAVEGIKLALRAQPVSVRSACLKFRAYSWSAFVPDSSARSLIR